MQGRDLATLYFRWCFGRAACARGWWLVTSLYLVVVADLTPFQLVFIGVAQSLLAVCAEIPAGVLADTVSRKWSLVVAQVLSGAGMLITGLVTDFPAIVATQMLWGLGWTFSSGADVAWLTDELDDTPRTPRVLTAGARWGEIGGFAGIIAFGTLAWLTSLQLAIVAGGGAMMAMGGAIAALFPETQFVRATGGRVSASMAIFLRGFTLARRDGEILVVLAATVLIHGVAESARLYPRHLLDIGFPGTIDPVAWLTALGLATLAIGAIALRAVEAHVAGEGAARRIFALACAVGTVGLFILALAPDTTTAMAGIVLAGGITTTVTRSVGATWVNRRVTSDVRATVQSFVAQAEYTGEILVGFGLALVAARGGVVGAIAVSACLLAFTALFVARSGDRGARAQSVD